MTIVVCLPALNLSSILIRSDFHHCWDCGQLRRKHRTPISGRRLLLHRRRAIRRWDRRVCIRLRHGLLRLVCPSNSTPRINTYLIDNHSGGTESIAVTAGETKDPAKNIPKVVRNVFWRIILFYIISIVIISLNVPYTYPDLSSGETATSPFTIVFVQAGSAVAGLSLIHI